MSLVVLFDMKMVVEEKKKGLQTRRPSWDFIDIVERYRADCLLEWQISLLNLELLITGRGSILFLLPSVSAKKGRSALQAEP